MKGVDEDESEHIRLMKEQEEYEKQSMYEMPNIDDNEYTRLIEISESQRKRDVNMEDIELNDEEEEKLPLDSRINQKEISMKK